MKKPTLAVYCARSWIISTLLATGTIPITSPPLTAETINLKDLKADIIYIRLHGLEGQPYLYGSPRWETSISGKQVESAPEIFSGSIVYLEGCYGTTMADAFLNAGARAVVGDKDVSWGRKYRLGPSSKIGKYWLKQIKQGASVRDALAVSLAKVKHLPYELYDGMFVVGEMGVTI